MKPVVRIAELPSGDIEVFRNSSFFRNSKQELPSPAAVREEGSKSQAIYSSYRRYPVRYPELSLIVKYGTFITKAEGQCLWYLNRALKHQVPTPEVYGWQVDRGQTFIYMQLVEGDTLQDRWPSLGKQEREVIARQLRGCITAWRELQQDFEPYFIGHIGGQGVYDYLFDDVEATGAGPFDSVTSFHDYIAHFASCGPTDGENRHEHPYLAGFTDDKPIVFTHGDLARSNIIIRHGSEPRIEAIIDWHQSGWYPIDWEWIKAFNTCDSLDSGWRDTEWLNQALEPADKGYHGALEYIQNYLGC